MNQFILMSKQELGLHSLVQEVAESLDNWKSAQVWSQWQIMLKDDTKVQDHLGIKSTEHGTCPPSQFLDPQWTKEKTWQKFLQLCRFTPKFISLTQRDTKLFSLVQ